MDIKFKDMHSDKTPCEITHENEQCFELWTRIDNKYAQIIQMKRDGRIEYYINGILDPLPSPEIVNFFKQDKGNKK